MKLDKAKVGQIVTVETVTGHGALRRRIMDMGITKGASVYINRIAPLGDPIELNVRGYRLMLRKQDAQMVEVE